MILLYIININNFINKFYTKYIMKYKGIALEGGGVSGIAYVGAITALEDLGYDVDFTHFVGSSAGSIIASMLACKASSSWIKKTMKEFDFNDLMDDSWGVSLDIVRLYEEYGWYKGDALLDKMETILYNLTGINNITFKQLYNKYKKTLVITKTQILYPRCKLIVMDYKSHPDHPVSLAVRESSSIPYFFKAVKDKDNNIFVDGGVLLNYPIELLYNYLPPSECMGLSLKYHEKFDSIDERPVESHIEFIKAMAETWRDGAMFKNIGMDDKKRTCRIKTYLKSIDFDINEEQKDKDIESGYKYMMKFIKRQ